MHCNILFILISLGFVCAKKTSDIFSRAYGILRRLDVCHRTFSLKHNEENK